MKTDAHTDSRFFGPRMRFYRALSIEGSGDGVTGALECDEEGVSLSPDLDATMQFESLAQKLAMRVLDVCVALVT